MSQVFFINLSFFIHFLVAIVLSNFNYTFDFKNKKEKPLLIFLEDINVPNHSHTSDNDKNNVFEDKRSLDQSNNNKTLKTSKRISNFDITRKINIIDNKPSPTSTIASENILHLADQNTYEISSLTKKFDETHSNREGLFSATNLKKIDALPVVQQTNDSMSNMALKKISTHKLAELVPEISLDENNFKEDPKEENDGICEEARKKGVASIRNKDYLGGINVFVNAIPDCTDNPEIYFYKGWGEILWAFSDREKFKEKLTSSIESLQKAIDIKPNEPKYHEKIAFSYLSLKKFKNALEHYSIAIDLTPQNYLNYFYRSQSYESENDNINIIYDLTTFIENYSLHEPDYSTLISEAYFLRGINHSFANNEIAAIEDFNSALSLDITDHFKSKVLFSRGKTYLEFKDYEKKLAALKDFTYLVEKNHSDPQYFYYKAITHNLLDDFENALSAINASIKINNTDRNSFRERIKYLYNLYKASGETQYLNSMKKDLYTLYNFFTKSSILKLPELKINYDKFLDNSVTVICTLPPSNMQNNKTTCLSHKNFSEKKTCFENIISNNSNFKSESILQLASLMLTQNDNENSIVLINKAIDEYKRINEDIHLGLLYEFYYRYSKDIKLKDLKQTLCK